MNQRKSNFELLRIISMAMIIACHFGVHSGFNLEHNILSINTIWIQFMRIWGSVGVNIFVLISGYFLVKSNKFKVEKVFKLVLQTLFYSVIIYLIFTAFSNNFSILGFIRSIFCIEMFPQYWFVTAYFLLYIFSPYINHIVNGIKKNSYLILLMIMTVYFCLIPTVLGNSNNINDLIWFIYLYCIGGFIRLYLDKIKYKTKTMAMIAICFIMIALLIIVAFDIAGVNNAIIWKYSLSFYDRQDLLPLVIAVSIFLCFKNIEIKENIGINYISSTTFGVYLIHDNELVREFIWKDLFKCAELQNSNILIIYSILVISTIYFSCTLIEFIRIYGIEKQYMIIIEKWLNKIIPKIDNVYRKLDLQKEQFSMTYKDRNKADK